MDWAIALNGRCLEYYEKEHIYLVDGVIVPSVTQVVDYEFGHKYDAVSPAVLKRAAERGTRVHEAIEKYCKTGVEEPLAEVHNFKWLQSKLGFEVVANELPVLIDYEGITIAGRLEMVVKMNGHLGGVDIKSTSTLDKGRTALQLNLYRIGFKQCYGEDWRFIMAMHLKDDTRKMVSLPINLNYTEDLLRGYKESL